VRKFANLVLIVIVAASAGWLAARNAAPTGAIAEKKPESVLERVLATNTLRCGYFFWPPYMMRDANTGAYSGLNYEYVMELGRMLGLKIEWTEETAIGDYATGLQSNRYDALCTSVWPDEHRLRVSTTTAPLYYSSGHAIVRGDDKRFDGDLAKLDDPSVTIVAIEGDVGPVLARNRFPKAKLIELAQTADYSQLFESVVTKKADAFFSDLGVYYDYVEKNGDKVRVVEDKEPLAVFPEVLAVKYGDTQLRDFLNDGISMMTSNHIVATYLRKYPKKSSIHPALRPVDLDVQ